MCSKWMNVSWEKKWKIYYVGYWATKIRKKERKKEWVNIKNERKKKGRRTYELKERKKQTNKQRVSIK